MSRQPKRSEVLCRPDVESTTISSIPKAWEAEFNQVAGMISTIANFKGRLGECAKSAFGMPGGSEAHLKGWPGYRRMRLFTLPATGTCPRTR